MYLKALEMRGFKSFPDKTRLDFQKGVTAVVGPNGSGKSNISDAIRWVLGEMSPKSLRGSKMEDVIFAGTAARAQTGFCEVSLIVDNSSDELKTGTDEVKVTRKYFRNGDSEYKINEKPSRLKDIYELFLNTGIGREGYSVIGQGKISEVLSQKSDERRHIFEEAAGISKFRYRKNDAEKKLAETDANLLRLTDILGEISSRIGPLERDAENAKKYLVLAARKKELEIAIWLDRITKAHVESEKIQKKYDEAKKNCEEKEAELERAEKELLALTDQKQLLLLDTEAKRNELSAIDEEKSVLAGRKAVSENTILHHDERKNTIKTDIEALRDVEIKALEDAAALAREKSVEQGRLLEKIKGELLSAKENVALCSEMLEKSEKELEEKNAQLREIKEKLINIKISQSSIESALKSDNERKLFLSNEVDKINAEIAETKKYLDAARERKNDFISEKQDLKTSIEEETREFSALEKEYEQLIAQKNALQGKFTTASQRRETLDRMDKLLEGYPGSVKAVMANSALRGIRGPVSRLLSSAGEYVTAIETALGAGVSNIVVETEEDAKAAIRYLKERNAGRATFLPLTSIKGNVLSERGIEKERGVVGIASSLVNFNSKYTSVAEYLLGRCVVVDNIDSASVIAKKYSYRFKIVTLDGQVVNAGGSYTGGSAANRAGVMSRSADIEALDCEIKKLGAEISVNSESIKENTEKREQAQLYIEALKNDLSAADSGLYKSEADIKLHTEHIEACGKRLENAKTQLSEYDPEGIAAKLSELQNRYNETEKQVNDLELSLKETDEKTDLLADELDSAKEKENSLILKSVEAQKDFESCGNNVKNAYLRVEEANKRLQALFDEEKLLNLKVEDIKTQAQKDAEQLLEAENASLAKRAEIEGLVKKTNELEYSITRLINSQKEINRDKDVFFKDYTKYASMLEQYEKDYDNLTSKLWEEYEITFSDAKAMELPVPKAEDVTELNSVKAKIRALGTVNVNAVEEYKETKERFDFMTAQVEDLENSKKSLENVIRRLESDMKSIFSAAINQINKSFGEVFTELFGGGRGEIIITEPDNILESGIEIIVQPPGKMVKSISLLSGGEQAFTAIALYFAILKVHTAPFYVFDEIEAALDDVNVNRFGAYLRKHSSDTQFIVITHRRGTMESAETLYGVTMPEKGVSTFLKLTLDEVEKKTGVKL